MNNAFDEIIGYESVKEQLYQIMDMFKNPELYEQMGARPLHGLCIFGKPGTGKTMLANALIKECGVPYYTIKKSKNDNETLEAIESAFEKASQNTPSIVLCDDCDKLSERSDEDEDDKFFVALQTAIDSVHDKNVMVIATVNNRFKFPRSLLRRGRIDREICLLPPTFEDAQKIIAYYMGKKRVDPNVNYEDISKMITYSSCADLESILNESAIQSAYLRKDAIDMDDIVKAVLTNAYDSPDENYPVSKDEVEKTSWHEAGHAVIAEALKRGGVGFVNVSASGRDSMEGFTHLCLEYKRRPENILIALGGKVAVELFYEGRCGSGCHSDLERAFNLIRAGLSESGTCGIGMIDVANERFPTTSESLNSRNESVTQAELERYLFLARDILIKNKEFLKAMKNQLVKKKYLLYSDIQAIAKKHRIVEIPLQ